LIATGFDGAVAGDDYISPLTTIRIPH